MREQDPIWNALDECFGPVRTRSERGRRNVAVKDLREAGALPTEVRVAYEWCEKNFTIFTEMALVAHFSRALHETAKPQVSRLGLVRRMAENDD